MFLFKSYVLDIDHFWPKKGVDYYQLSKFTNYQALKALVLLVFGILVACDLNKELVTNFCYNWMKFENQLLYQTSPFFNKKYLLTAILVFFSGWLLSTLISFNTFLGILNKALFRYNIVFCGTNNTPLNIPTFSLNVENNMWIIVSPTNMREHWEIHKVNMMGWIECKPIAYMSPLVRVFENNRFF